MDAAQGTDPDNNNGELVISLPPEITSFVNDSTTFKINIEYSLEQPSGGVHFVIPDGEGSLTEVNFNIFMHINYFIFKHYDKNTI